MSITAREELNQLYKPLDDQMRALLSLLKEWHGEKVTYGWFNSHYHKNAAGEYQKDIYPIPVISVRGLCDIEIDFDGITVTTKLSKEQIQKTDWTAFSGVPFELYGVEDYLKDYGTERAIQALSNRVRLSSEKEFFISFSLSRHIQADQVISFIKMVRDKQFYY